jgi:hypothetical protein
MSVTNVENTRNASFADYDFTKFLLGDNGFAKADFTDGGAGSNLTQGLVVAKVLATGLLVPWAPAAVDGSENPVGLLWLGGSEDIDVAASATVNLEYVNKGSVNKNLITFPGAETLATATPTGATVRLEDFLEDLGLILEDGIELTGVDNS